MMFGIIPSLLSKDFTMSEKGQFQKNYFSLQLQLQTLLEEAGGENLLPVLDQLCEMSGAEQKITLRIFQRALQKFSRQSIRLTSSRDRALKDFEEGLYQDILGAMKEASTIPSGKPLEIISGGKDPARKDDSLIHLEEARRSRRQRRNTLVG